MDTRLTVIFVGYRVWSVLCSRQNIDRRMLGELSSFRTPLAVAGMGWVLWRGQRVLPDTALHPSSRSFSELYMLSLKEPSRRGAPEPVQDETVKLVMLPPKKQLLHFCLKDSSSPPGPGDLTEERTEFLHSHNSLSPRRYTLWASLLGPESRALEKQLSVLSHPYPP